jgi:hypothetical protein
MQATPELHHFVRQTLGCGCPDSVFDSVRIDRAPLLPGGAQPAWWIEIGGRLLIAVCDDAPGLAARLPEVFDAARTRRDATGFNRFRLVVVVTPATDSAALERAFAPIGGADDRLHLHPIEPARLPPLAATETASA